MAVVTGLDRWVRNRFADLKGQRVGLVCNQATIASDFVHLLDHVLPLHRSGQFDVAAVFGPQHGIWGHTQDNMIEWEGYRDPVTGLLFHSLYGEHREPTDAMLDGLDHLVVDLPDIGSRYYTFAWTMALCMKACERLGIPVTVLDRPNPLGGVRVEGPLIDPGFESFVGWHSVPIRHGLTLGELATWLKSRHYPGVDLRVVRCEGWSRTQEFEQTGLPWAMPSPNMPTPDTARVYPGMCLLEGTRLSEGRGTTRPFEIFGAPYFDGHAFCDRMNGLGLPGCWFRPVQFEPTFQKFAKEVCQGAFLHVSDREVFEPVLVGCQILIQAHDLYPEQFKWLDPPYEYVWDKMPIDILAGGPWLRQAVEERWSVAQVREHMARDGAPFAEERQAVLFA